MKSNLFFTDMHKEVERKVAELINQHEDFLSKSTAESPRAAGDAIQSIIADHFDKIINKDIFINYESNFARRAMADLAFEDNDKIYYIVDVKTHRTDTKFNMPNIISVERLARFYEDDKNYFSLLMISYSVVGTKVTASEVKFVPIEFVSWDCLTIGALGWGQIQIANSNIVKINQAYSRKRWMVELCDTLMDFYPKEIDKISKRIEHFKKIKEKWESRPD